ncbi:MAG: TonB family protein [Chromatiales bacterium]|nr:MAG: TonB family protein [Chromatiales bacterium]
MTKQALTCIAMLCVAGPAIAQDKPEGPVLPDETETTDVPLQPLDPAMPDAEGAQPSEPTTGAEPLPAAVDAGDATGDPSPESAAPADAEPDPPGRRTVLYQRMVTAIDEARYADAVEAARGVAQLTEQEFGPDSIELSSPLDNLATTLMLKGDLVDAEQAYLRSIAIIKQNEGQLSPRLINAQVGLGATYNRAGLYDKAEEAFSTALRLNNVNEGFYNLEQMKIRDGLTETYIGLEEIEEANFHQEVQLEIHQRRLGEDNPETAPAMYKLARWYERSGQVEQSRYMYQRAQQMIRRTYGKESLEMVAAYEGLAGTFERQGLVSESAGSLKKALKIIEAQPEIDRPKQAELLVQLGDLYGSSGRFDTAIAYYERAWQALSLESGYEDLREEFFSEPVRVTGLGWGNLRYAPGDVSDWNLLSDGYVLVRYDVSEKGRVKDVVVIESNPSDLMDRRVAEALRRSYFRPRFADGVAVVSEGLLYRHDFYYRPKDPGRSEDAGKPIEAPDDGGGRLEYPGASDG